MDREVVLEELERNRRVRRRTSRRLDKYRGELLALVQRGAEAGVPVGEMASAAGVSREAASRLIHHGRTYVSGKDAA